MKHFKFLLFTALACLLLLSGCASKRYAKKGAKYEASGMYEMAVKCYITSLEKNHKNTKARIGLMRTSTIFLEELQDKMETAYNAFNDETVVNTYTQMTQLKKSCDRMQVPLEIDQRYTTQFNEIKSRYAENCYQKALVAKREKRYKDAIDWLNKIAKVNPNYKDSQAIILYCKCQPIYELAQSQMDAKQYRTAYNNYQKVLHLDASFKEAKSLQQNCLFEGKQQLAFKDINYLNYNYSGFANRLANRITQEVNERHDPFLEIVDLKTIQQLEMRQKERMLQDVNFLPTEIIPVRSYLRLRVNNISAKRSKLKRTRRKGFIRKVINDSVIYTKTYYYEYSQELKVSGDFNLSATDVKTGSILISQPYSRSQKDAIHYVNYNGDRRIQIVPGYWKTKSTKYDPSYDTAEDSRTTRRKIEGQRDARRKLKSENDLYQELIQDMSSTMSYKIRQLAPNN